MSVTAGGTPPYGLLVNTVTLLLRPPYFVSAKSSIFWKENPINAAILLDPNGQIGA